MRRNKTNLTKKELKREDKKYICGAVRRALKDNKDLTPELLSVEANLNPRILQELLRENYYGISVKTLIRRLKKVLEQYKHWDWNLEDIHKDYWGTGASKARRAKKL